MGIKNTHCHCGEAITVLTGTDALKVFRNDGKQVIYTNEPRNEDGNVYDIFRCRGCGDPIHMTCNDADYVKGS